jgi:hypothetical protein
VLLTLFPARSRFDSILLLMAVRVRLVAELAVKSAHIMTTCTDARHLSQLPTNIRVLLTSVHHEAPSNTKAAAASYQESIGKGNNAAGPANWIAL